MTKQCASVPYARPRWALNMAQHLYPHSSAWFCIVVYIWTLQIVNLSFLSMTHFDSIDFAVCDLATNLEIRKMLPTMNHYRHRHHQDKRLTPEK